jgi:predicted metal-dependent enzyme (double-stranded beta helix superfamily)
MTLMGGRFQIVMESVEPLIRQLREPSEVIRAVEPHLHQLVSENDWLEDSYRRVIPSKAYAQYLLHRPKDHAFSVVSLVWNPGQGSPIHDHCTWGVIGQLEGEEEEARFRLSEQGLEQTSVVVSRPGNVSHVYPPHRDIHQIRNRTATPTISIHIYGGDIGSQRRHVYDPLNGKTSPFVSGYDNL